MDLFWLIIIISAIVKALGGDKKKKAAQPSRPVSGPDFGKGFAPGTAQPAAAGPVPPKPAPQKTMMPPRQESFRPVTMPMQEAAQPRVHTHLAPDCEEHDRPGSLKVTSTEGKDPCHAAQLTASEQQRPALQEDGESYEGLQLDWSGDNMVKAFIMQEVLTRPCERRRRA